MKSPLQTALVLPATFLALSIFSQHALAAASVSGARVTQLIAESDGTNTAYFVYVSAAPTGAAACGTVTASQYRFAIDPTTQVGKAQIANVLAAYATGALVDVYGLGTCLLWPDTESVERIALHN